MFNKNKIQKSLIIFLVTGVFSFLLLSHFNRSHAQQSSTNVGAFSSTLDAALEELVSLCNISAEEAAAIAEARKLKYGFDPNATAGAQYIGDCTTPVNQAGGQGSNFDNTTLGKITGFTTILYKEKPSSAGIWFNQQYLAITGQNQVSAQTPIANTVEFYRPGSGFTLLQPLQGLWAWSRNMAYVAFIILIVVIGFMILFRNRLDGQTPITIFNSIPTMILSLVLITFSYPICAFFVDIITIGSDLVQNLLIARPGAPGYEFVWLNDAGWQTGLDLNNDGQKDIINRFVLQPDDPQMSVWQIFTTSGAQLCKDPAVDEECQISNLLPDDTGQGNAIAQGVDFVLRFIQFTGVDNTLVGLVIGFASFTASIKLFLGLLNKYIILTVGVLLSPWYFFFAAIPSQSSGKIVDFLKVHLGAALTFVAIYGVFLFLVVFVQSPVTRNFNWVPPLLGYSEQIIQGNIIAGVISYGIYLATPAIPEMIDKVLDIPTGGELFSSVGERVRSAGGQVAGYGRTLAASFLPNVPGIGGGGRR